MILMKTIDAYEKDVFSQSEFLRTFHPPKTLSKASQKNVIFTGAGDSFVSCMLAEAFSNYLVKSVDPLDLLKNKTLVKDKTVYFVSISGNTISNIKVAKMAKKSIAITSKPNSRLANVSNSSIILTSHSDVFTAGSVSFLESALTCISLVCPIKIPQNPKIFEKAMIDAKKSKLGKRIFVLGSMHTFPIAMYCAAKFYEIVGYDVHFQRIEQFSHMELFSIQKGDTVIIFEERNSHNLQLIQHLKKIGLFSVALLYLFFSTIAFF